MRFATRLMAGTLALAAAPFAFAQFDGSAPVAWRWAESTRVSPSGAPAEKEGVVYTAVGGRIYALEKETGNLKWRYPQGAPFEANFRSGVILAGNKILAAADNRVLYCVDAKTGEAVWQYNSADSILGTPVVAGSKVVFAQPSSINAVSLNDGTEAWPTPFKMDGTRIYPNLASWNDFAMFPGSDNRLHALDVNTGRLRWTREFARLTPTSAPIVFGDIIYMNASSYVVSMSAVNGAVRWQNSTGEQLAFSPAASSKGIVSVTTSGKVYAFDGNGRKLNAQAGDLKSNPVASPAYLGDLVAVPLSNGSIVTMNTVTGDTVWVYNFPPLVAAAAGGSSRGGGGAAGGTGDGGGLTSPPGGGGTVGGGQAAGGGRGRGAGAGGGQGGANPPAAGGGSGATGGEVKTIAIQGAGPAILAGETMLILASDGSLFAFDKKLGVDLTPPDVKMMWPNAGDQISPLPPAEFLFKLEDFGSGINPDTVSVTVNGKEVMASYDKVTQYLRVLIVAGGKVPPLPAGKVKFVVSSSDWIGNTSSVAFQVTVDPSIDRPLGGPPRSGGDSNNSTGGPTGPGRGGSAAGGRSGGTRGG